MLTCIKRVHIPGLWLAWNSPIFLQQTTQKNKKLYGNSLQQHFVNLCLTVSVYSYPLFLLASLVKESAKLQKPLPYELAHLLKRTAVFLCPESIYFSIIIVLDDNHLTLAAAQNQTGGTNQL